MTQAMEPVSVLILDADPAQRRLLAAHLSGVAGPRFRPLACGSIAEARLTASGTDASMLIADLDSVGGVSALGALAGIGRSLIATSARGSLNTAIEAMRAGAHDFLPKPIGAKALIERLEAAIAGWRPTGAVPARRKAATNFEGFVGGSALMLDVYEQVSRVAGSAAPVFLTGESGTGKEVCAEAIHARGGSDRPFVAINCAAISPNLLESEMFGHARGAFTGAEGERTGAAELADGGTLFLDEIGEMAEPLQAKLLRFIGTGTLHRVGDSRARSVNVRVICATNRDPLQEIAGGRFRADLFYRLNVLAIRLPALRDRPEDIVPLAEHFLARCAAEEGGRFTGFDEAAMALLVAHPWPGNVRQLQNAVRRLVVHETGPVVARAAVERVLSSFAPGGPPVPAGDTATAVRPFHEEERRIIEAALAAFGGNIARAAAALQINPSTIYRKRQAWQAAG